ncbi:MAG: DUF6288 domain-containing protein [Luteolibacter sp.]
MKNPQESVFLARRPAWIATQLIVSFFAVCGSLHAAGGDSGGASKAPDLTAGGQRDENHDWTLGASGMRGWLFAASTDTSQSRQILVTAVAKGSPADGILEKGDVILGAFGKPFDSDARTAFGKALGAAEAETGELPLLRWRDGETEEVIVKLEVLGAYSATAPYDCPKSKAIFEKGCEAIAEQMESSRNGANPMIRSLNALALLASGERKYKDLIEEEAKWAANYKITELRGFQSWWYGYSNLFLTEYYLATGDKSVLPGIKRVALEVANGQSTVGTWGHTFARKEDGILMGYGAMNAPALTLTMSLILAKEAGVCDPSIDLAIARSKTMLSFYIGKGAIPYGDHEPWTKTHDDNGKCSAASVMFDLMGDKPGTEFFSRMATASHNAERDGGHTGNFINILWALPGVSRLGPHATGKWMEEFGWYLDLARRHDGTYLYQGNPGTDKKDNSYKGWDSTGAYLLSYALPLKSLRLTGKKPSVITPADEAEAAMVVAAGNDWNRLDDAKAYKKYDDEMLLAGLGSWSPIVRERCASTLASRKANVVKEVIGMLKSGSLDEKRGACVALRKFGGNASGVARELEDTLGSDDLGLRILAAEALAAIGPEGRRAIPEMLKMASRRRDDDPRGMEQRYLGFILFQQKMSGMNKGMLSESLEGVDKRDLKDAVIAVLSNQDGKVRGAVASIFRTLSYEEIEPLMPSIYDAIVKQAPSGVMFSDRMRLSGLAYLSKHHIKEGLPLTVQLIEPDRWGNGNRYGPCLNALLNYGEEAKSQLPALRELEATLAEKSAGKAPDKNLLLVRKTIKEVEASTKKVKLQDLPH